MTDNSDTYMLEPQLTNSLQPSEPRDLMPSNQSRRTKKILLVVDYHDAAIEGRDPGGPLAYAPDSDLVT